MYISVFIISLTIGGLDITNIKVNHNLMCCYHGNQGFAWEIPIKMANFKISHYLFHKQNLLIIQSSWLPYKDCIIGYMNDDPHIFPR